MTGIHADVDRTHQGQGLLDEPLFKQAVTRERKRADRSGLTMALVLIHLPSASEPEPGEGAVVAHALGAATAEPDIVGWFEPPGVLGLIVPELAPAALAGTGAHLACTVRSAIAHQAGEDLAQQKVGYSEVVLLAHGIVLETSLDGGLSPALLYAATAK